ncbi:MAG: arsenite methyltransferase [Gemmatimonadaceae bacterium]
MTLVLQPRTKDHPDVEPERIRSVVRDKYGQAAVRAAGGLQASCGTSCCGDAEAARDPITSDLYQSSDIADLPAEAVLASLGCGNPTALADLKPGETVLDLGSGGGIDVLLSARRVGPTGKAYGLDMTEEMLALARDNQRRAGLTNAEFLRGEIENVPLPDSSVDVIISNCVINLSADKKRVLAEAYRVLKPGGRLAVSDVVVRGKMPPALRQEMELWAGCVAGALEDREYVRLLSAAGFGDISIEPTRVHGSKDLACVPGAEQRASNSSALDAIDGKVMSAFIRARKKTSDDSHEPIEPAG